IQMSHARRELSNPLRPHYCSCGGQESAEYGLRIDAQDYGDDAKSDQGKRDCPGRFLDIGSIRIWRSKENLLHCHQRIARGKGCGNNSQRSNYEAIFGRRISSSNESALEQEEFGQKAVCRGQTGESQGPDEGRGGCYWHFTGETSELAQAPFAPSLKHDRANNNEEYSLGSSIAHVLKH